MTAYNFRSLLLAAIVLSNCITWTASRHHYAHNVHQHRTRHRRQGAGLYLPASYVIPGGEGSGAWGEWGEVSPCSRTCGGGVASQKRICLQLGPDGQPQCTGGDTKFFSCQTQDCPAGSNDFRAEQCAEFNDIPFRGYKYNWVPYLNAPNPCELNCMPHGERFYYRHKRHVTDGTRCNDESFDVCVNGTCQPVGCDMMLGSNAREDKCRECRGNGANCHTTEGIIDSQDLMKGYNDILLIPEGSTNIIIEEIEPSSNFLALKAKNGTYYLNGHYNIDFPRSLIIAGTLWYYERSQRGFNAPDKLRCQGPTNQPLYLSLLLQDENVGIRYEYSVPNDVAPPTDKRYNWVHEEFTPCSTSCGGGFQTRNVTCRSREELEIVDEGLCDEGLKPPTNQSCSPDPCPARWVEGPWGECSKRCGAGGVKSREVTCQKIIANGYQSIVADKECFDLLGPKPELFQKCNEDAPCPTWFVGHWKPCDKLCDEGKQTRQVTCYQKKNGRIEVLDDKDCTEEKPTQEQTCMLQPCEGVDWVTSDWSGCDTCFSKTRSRQVVCATKDRKVLNDSVCSYHTRPVEQEDCKEVPPCEVQWYATQWSKCSVECGDGVQTRKVFCGLYDGKNVDVVDDSKCADLPKYNETKPCTVPKDQCPSQWFAGPWTVCTKECGGGEQFRRVMCLNGLKEVSDCDVDTVLDSTQLCNTGPCDLDETLPVNSSTSPIMDEEDCDYDSDYTEVGLEEDLSKTTLDMALSDSPSTGYAEFESAGISTTDGSGFGSSLSTDDLTTFEGSGFSASTFTTDTGSGETEITEEIEKSTTKDLHTKRTTLPPRSKASASTVETETTDSTGSTEESGSTESISTDDKVTGSEDTSSTDAKETGPTTAAGTGSTESSISTDSSSSGETTETGITGAKATGSTGETVSTSSGDTSSTDAKETGPTTPAGTESSISTDSASTISGETTETEITGETGSTNSTDEDKTETTTAGETGSTESSVSTAAKETGSTSSSAGETGSTESSISKETATTSDTNSTETEETDSTVSSSTDTSDTSDTESTESTITESTVTDTTETETTLTESTGSEDTSSTDSTEETNTTPTAESGSTDSSATTASEGLDRTTVTPVDKDTKRTTVTRPHSISTSFTVSTDLSTTELTTDSSETTIETSTPESTESGSTAESGPTDISESTTELGSTAESESTTESGSTDKSESTTESGLTTESGATSEESNSTTIEAITTDETASTGDTESSTSGSESTSESATESTGSETAESGSTESTAESGSTTEGTTFSEETSSTEGTESTEGGSTTESGSTPESTGTEESTISTYSTTEGTTETGSTEVSGSTTEGLTTTEGSTTEGVSSSAGTTSWGISSTIFRKKSICKVRSRKPKCEKTEFGCCPDKKTAAAGPFDEGCIKPHTCKESTYGCCPDGLSPAQGDNNEGCPVEPCEDTLFGCCLSDNKTAAQGNDQDGCPPPPPACASSEYGCCADNNTEATGPEKEGCPETETSTTDMLTETTAITDESGGTTESTIGEGSTTEGATDVTGSTMLELCASFKFGCCSDNETEAPGPDGQGCPCNATEFGCCPDGVSPAQGVENEGCPGPCSASQHGCCQDGKTPAHGPDFEGCCLSQAFGCCPDNRKPAEGPHLEGCGCQYARHGCCPDNVTIAQGPDNQGCGCQYTEHGCCPDRHTEAAGPNYEGCACNTYQFGCCPDGVTIAKDPDHQGCHCRYSKYGCCGDEETPATGHDAAGCDCSSSKYGCCPDGRTEAAGPKFLGCTDAPENKQAVCSLSTDPGSCHNFTAVWFYDLGYGGCSRFWYGGCEGNGNRFGTKEECEDVCVQPAPKDACKLPSVKGPCDGDYVRWQYNSTLEQCIPFRYGGCLGNSNNFETRELCQTQCEPSTTAGQCDLPIEQGSCAGNFSRWGFNTETHRCEQFIWGGCEGNSNRFSTEAACQMRCAPTKPQCSMQQQVGNCTDKEALWSFSQSENRCVPFYYSGCGGNDNRFDSREACEQTCPSAYEPDRCTLPAQTGECSNYRERWFYDTSIKRCRQFYYGGCGGNENNFGTEAECDNTCSEDKNLPVTTPRPTAPQPEPQPQPQPQPGPEPERPDFCFMEIDAGPCTNMSTQYAYDSNLGICRPFQYGGCGGNRNNFPDENYCNHYCHPIQDVCQLPMLVGPCDDSLVRWFYDASTDSCSQFTYGGCEGNDNRFESPEACESRCRTGSPQTTPTPAAVTTPTSTTAIPAGSLSKECRVPAALEECQFGGLVWYYDQQELACVSHSNQEAGAFCRHTGTFTSQEACERSCGAFQGIDVCHQRLDPGPCQSYVTKVYFDEHSGQCREFAYGGCLGGANRFSSVEECSQVCKTAVSDPCTLPPEQGNCFAFIEQWYFDSSSGQCNQFIYTGCSGNENRFETRQQCESQCLPPGPAATTTTAAPIPPPQPTELECTTPRSLAPCGNNVTVFYYDSESRACRAGGFGGCGYPNSYRTEEECERRCGEFRDTDVCGARLDPGPCRAAFPKFYWDSISGSCQPYTYGGCLGGPNRFSSVEECEEVCGDTGPARECLQEVDTGESCGAAPAPRWHYSVAHVDCVVFAYQGCGGNDNNFRSYAECADLCGLSRARDDGPKRPAPADCEMFRQECESLVCQYGIGTVMQEGCQRCVCNEDPCLSANCSPHEHCVAFAIRNPETQEPQYSARCVPGDETNNIADCKPYEEECSRLRCQSSVQRTRTADGCERCSCAQVEVNCEPLREECERLQCNYGIERTTGPDGCERCRCKPDRCRQMSCAPNERCVVMTYKHAVDQEIKSTVQCRPIEKPGVCPADDETNSIEVTCRQECTDDADCLGLGKCCRRGCSVLCVLPDDPTSPHPLLTTTYAPDAPAAPQASAQHEPEVAAAEGGKATLRCLFHGNPPPKITWRRGELTIDGNVGRYRLTSDGALEIVSLYRNDTGVYICVADNDLGQATQEIHLIVNDPVKIPVGIAGDENAVITGELGRPLLVRCLAYGYPPPTVYWYHGFDGAMVPYNNAVYEARESVLLIRSLTIDTLGQYTCQAYNGRGKAASWVVVVQAYRPDGIFVEHEYLVPRVTVGPMPRTQPPTTRETVTTTTTEVPRPLFTVPVSTHLSPHSLTLNTGADLRLTCEVDGFPDPEVYWTKDGVRIQTDERTSISGTTVSRLSVSRASLGDSGVYACHASNAYSAHSDTAQINVQQQLVPAKCTDSPFFANCGLIVSSNFCNHKYYSKFCCKSCVEAGQLDPHEAELQADQPFRRK